MSINVVPFIIGLCGLLYGIALIRFQTVVVALELRCYEQNTGPLRVLFGATVNGRPPADAEPLVRRNVIATAFGGIVVGVIGVLGSIWYR